MGLFDERGFALFDAIGEPRQEPGDRLGRRAAKLDRGLRCAASAASQSPNR
jgi:hypothetical protein